MMGRRRQAAELLRIFTGDIRKWIIHHCLGRHCCPNGRASAVGAAVDVIRGLLERRVVTPALNRWLTVFPVVSLFTLMFVVHRIFPRAELLLSGMSVDVADSAGVDDLGSASEGEAEAAKIGAPKLESHFRKESRRRKTKMLNWLRDHATLPKLMVWQCMSPSIMHVHAAFFKHGGLHPDAQGESALFNCMSLSRSQPLKALHTLCCSFDTDKPEHNEVWKLMLAWYGSASTWSPDVLNYAVGSRNILCGNI